MAGVCGGEAVSEKRFPVLRPGPLARLSPRTIPWRMAEVVYAEYSRQYGTRQSLERIAERGGFGDEEILDFLEAAWFRITPMSPERPVEP